MNLYSLLFFLAALMPLTQCRRLGRHSRRRPNIVLMMTDDQDVALGSMEFMPKTLRLFRQRGVEFINGFVTTPICCPSRSSILTGLYVHNHNVLTNNDNCTGAEWKTQHEPHTFGAYLQRSGYRTGFFGKYLNEYDGNYIPPGWDEWMGLVKNSRFYNYTVNYNGKKIKHGADYAKDYFTDLITNDSIAFFERNRRLYPDKPVLMVLSFPAPHGPEDPAPQHADLFADVETHRTDSWNYAPNPDKQWLLQHTGKMEPVHVVFTDMLHRRRLQTLQSVDDNVQKVVTELRELRELSETYLIYTSDHGYHLGQFGLIKGKNMPYEFDLKVPFFVRGPDVARGKRVPVPVANIDIAPSIMAMAGLPVPPTMDGRSFLPLLQDNERITNHTVWRNSLLVERGKMPKLNRIRERLLLQRDSFSKEIRIEAECKKPEYQSPCKENQFWECRRNEIGRWRIFKCRAQLEIENDCSCRRRRTRRHHRKNNRYDYQLKRVISLDDLDSEYGSSVPIPDSLINEWQADFIAFLRREDVVNSGQWYQGDFGVSSDIYHSFNSSRSKRSTRAKKQREFENDDSLDDVSVNALCVHFNTSVMCEPEVYKSPKTWERQKSKVDGRIQTLRRRLSAFKDIRKHLRQGRPLRDASDESDDDEDGDDNGEVDAEDNLEGGDRKRCRCGPPRISHPLHSSASVEISAADLLAYQTERRNARKNRRGKGKKKKGKSTEPPKPGTKRWLREDGKHNCNVPQMNCFTHNPQHWRTPPLWPDAFGEFCFCQNSNNNTYWCLRTVNSTTNTLYCEFVTGFVSYYDVMKDPDQLTNAVYTLPLPILEQLSGQLAKLKACKGAEECDHYSGLNWDRPFVPRKAKKPAG